MMKEFLWIAGVRLLSGVMLMARLCLEAGGIPKAMFAFGLRGRKPRNGKPSNLHRQRVVGLPRSRAWIIERLPPSAVPRGLSR